MNVLFYYRFLQKFTDVLLWDYIVWFYGKQCGFSFFSLGDRR